MKKCFIIALILTCILALSACAEAGEISNETTVEEHKTIVSDCGKLIPLAFDLSKGFDAATAEVMQAKSTADPATDYYDLHALEHYYIPTYAEEWCEPITLIVNGGASGTIVVTYRINDAPADSYRWALTLQFDRDAEYGKELFEHSITVSDAIPFEPCEGVYYTDVYNPGDNGELSLTQFFWVHDGYSFMMQVWPEVMEQILENDPNALKGALFELEKVMLESDSDNTETE